MKKKHKSPVSKKISKLREEGVSEDQAVAESINMEKEGRLTKSGGYKRVSRKKRRGGRRV